jgi:hypothetical protein
MIDAWSFFYKDFQTYMPAHSPGILSSKDQIFSFKDRGQTLYQFKNNQTLQVRLRLQGQLFYQGKKIQSESDQIL